MTSQTVRIAASLWTWAALLRPLKHVMAFDALVRLVHTAPRRDAREPAFERSLERYLASRSRFPRRAPGNCLERSLGAYRLLCAAGAEPTVVVGLKLGAAGAIRGHVWVLVDGRVLAEQPADVAAYTPVVRFDADARQHASGVPSGIPAGIRFA